MKCCNLFHLSLLFIWLFFIEPQKSFAIANDFNLSSLRIEELNQILSESQSHDTLRAHAYLELIERYFESQPDTIIPLAQKTLKIGENGLQNNPSKIERGCYQKIIADAAINMGLIFELQGNYDQALLYFNKSLKISKALEDAVGISSNLNNKGDTYFKKGDYSSALDNYNRSLTIQKQLGDSAGIAYLLNNVGRVYFAKGATGQALDYFFDALNIREFLADEHGIMTSLIEIGHVYLKLEDYQMALDYYLKAFDLSQKIEDKKGLALSYISLGRIYMAQNYLDKALDYFFIGLKIQEHIGLKDEMAETFQYIGLVFYSQKDYPQASEYFNKSLILNTQLNNEKGRVDNWINLAKVSLKEGKLKACESYGSRAFETSQKIGFTEEVRDVSLVLSQLYNRENNSREAYRFLSTHMVLKDSLQNEVLKEKAAYYDYKYNVEKQRAIVESDFKNRISAERKRRQFQIKMVLIALIGMSFIIIFLFYLFNRLKLIQNKYDKTIAQNSRYELELNDLTIYKTEAEKDIQLFRNIQNQFAPQKKKLSDYFTDYFLIEPHQKDVSSCFFWVDTVDSDLYMAFIYFSDPRVNGALLSTMGSELLNHYINTKQAADVGGLLSLLQNVLSNKLAHIPDFDISMQGALIKITPTNLILASHGISLLLLRNQTFSEIGNTIKPNPISNLQPRINTHTVKLKENDALYCFSPPILRILNKSNLKSSLLEMHNKPMIIQKERLLKKISSYKESFPEEKQTCGFGVTFKRKFITNA